MVKKREKNCDSMIMSQRISKSERIVMIFTIMVGASQGIINEVSELAYKQFYAVLNVQRKAGG